MTIDATRCFTGLDAPRDAWASRLHEWASALKPGDSGPVSREVLVDLMSELGRLRAERTPFAVVMSAALERDLADGIVDTAVLDLAERLGFRRFDLSEAYGSKRIVWVGGVPMRVVAIDDPPPTYLDATSYDDPGLVEIVSSSRRSVEVRLVEVDR